MRHRYSSGRQRCFVRVRTRRARPKLKGAPSAKSTSGRDSRPICLESRCHGTVHDRFSITLNRVEPALWNEKRLPVKILLRLRLRLFK